MSIDIFAPTAERRTVFGQLNAGVKVIAILVLSLSLLLIKDWVSAASILLLEALALLACGINPLALLGRFWPVLFGAIISGWSTALMAEKTGATLLDFGPFFITSGSLNIGIALTLRGLALVLPSILLVATTDPTDMADSLAQTLKLPARFVLAALAALRLLGILASEWNSLGQARRARGLGAHDTLLQRTRTAAGQSFALLVQAIRRGSRLSVTMEARGFGSPIKRTWARSPHYSKLDLYFALAILLIIALGYGLSLAAGTLIWLWN